MCVTQCVLGSPTTLSNSVINKHVISCQAGVVSCHFYLISLLKCVSARHALSVPFDVLPRLNEDRRSFGA